MIADPLPTAVINTPYSPFLNKADLMWNFGEALPDPAAPDVGGYHGPDPDPSTVVQAGAVKEIRNWTPIEGYDFDGTTVIGNLEQYIGELRGVSSSPGEPPPLAASFEIVRPTEWDPSPGRFAVAVIAMPATQPPKASAPQEQAPFGYPGHHDGFGLLATQLTTTSPERWGERK